MLNETDYATWLEMATEVEFLFGPMAQNKEFQDGIKACIQKGNSYCKVNGDGVVAGIIAVDRERNEISWLAVSEKHRGNNFGDDLVKKAVEELLKNGDIYVQTFFQNNSLGNSAREIYLKNGFVDLKNAGKNPAGIETVIMVKRAKK